MLSGPAVERIEESPLTELIVANTIQLSGRAAECKKIKALSVAPLLARAIVRIQERGSVSQLFNDRFYRKLRIPTVSLDNER